MSIHYCCVFFLGFLPFFATNAGATTNKGGIYCEGQKCFIEISKSSLDEYCEAAGSGITTEMPDTTTYAATGTHQPQQTTAEVTEPISQYYPSTTRRNSHCKKYLFFMCLRVCVCAYASTRTVYVCVRDSVCVSIPACVCVHVYVYLYTFAKYVKMTFN